MHEIVIEIGMEQTTAVPLRWSLYDFREWNEIA